MESSCMLAVIICRESVNILIISTVTIGTWPDNTLNDWIWLPNILEKTSKCNSFKCLTCLNDTHFCFLYFILQVVSYYMLSGMLIIVAVHRERIFYYYSLINCNPITISLPFPPPSLSPHLHFPPYSYPSLSPQKKNRPLRDIH